MKRFIALVCCLFLATLSFAAPLASNAKPAIPADVQQIISVDYRALRNSDSGMALKAKILPDNLKQFENALTDMGINPDTDIEGLSFVMFRAGKQLRSVGFATGDCEEDRFGLAGIRERARLLGGNTTVESTLGQGSCITVELPLVMRE